MYIINQLGEVNPQLLREIKGRFTTVNLGIVIGVSLVTQLFIYLLYQSYLPKNEGWNRYCQTEYCFQDFHGKWAIITKLWWLDIFTAMSIIGMIFLMVVGTYLLVADIANEAKKGTLDFIRLTPTQAKTIFLGKILGVPSLIYLGAMVALPLHWISGLQAGIPWYLLLTYYLVLLSGLFCFYSLAIAASLIMPKIGGFQPWLVAGLMLFFSVTFVMVIVNRYFHPVGDIGDWLVIFHPATVLHYLVKTTFLPPDTVKYLNLNNLAELQWYGKPLFSQTITGVSLILLNYALWSYWAWQGIQHRFNNPVSTVLTKYQSYWLSFSFIFVTLGFTLQHELWGEEIEHFTYLQISNLVFCLILIAILTPSTQVLKDWSRYRHREANTRGNLLKDLFLGEKSPAIGAIAVNLGIMTLYILPCLFLFLDSSSRVAIFSGWLLNANLILLLAVIYQLILLWKSPKFPVWGTTVLSLLGVTIFPVIIFNVFGFSLTTYPWLWLFSITPILATQHTIGMSIFFACLTQWLGITLLIGGITYQLKKAGESETKRLVG
ncbi:MAG: hypothetical protein EA365_03975 [Gloeocapsa sp. DLM2.Bin57]|nr:MAG: hypothetical protein EA365_03975 [Gloeocapsa sp. DLM2.Bin57]